jgi:hypothetical protein
VSTERTLIEGKFEEGIVKGRAEGGVEKRNQIIVTMLSRGMSDEDIMQITDISKEELALLKNEK